LSVEGLKQLKCRAFLKEYSAYLGEAIANTPEARAAARDKVTQAEEQAQDEALQYAQEIARAKAPNFSMEVDEELSTEEMARRLREWK
jgi:hypothetical protein